MVKVYVIQRAVIEDNNFKNPRWTNLYCVGSLSRAQRIVSCCQSDADSVYSKLSVHSMFRFEELVKI